MLKEQELKYISSRIEANKSVWNSRFYDIFTYTQPAKNYIGRSFENGIPSDLKQINLFTSAGTIGSDIFVNRIQNALAPIGKSYIKYNAKKHITGEMKQKLDEICKHLTDEVYYLKEDINLDYILNDAFYDLIAGSSILLKTETMNDISFEKCRLDNICLGTEKNQTVIRNFKIMACNVGNTFPELLGRTTIGNFVITEQKKYDFIDFKDILFYNENTKKYEYYLLQSGKHILYREYDKSPYYIFHWSRTNDMPFGDGIGGKAMPTLKRLNSYIKCNLELLPFAFPMFIAQAGSFLSNDIEFKPGGIITTTGDPNQVLPVSLLGNTEIFKMQITEEELKIKQIMLDYTLPTDPTQMTAAEVYARTSTADNQIYGNVSRLTLTIKKIAEDLGDYIFRKKLAPILDDITYKEIKDSIECEIVNRTSEDKQILDRINSYINNVSFDPQAVWQGLKRSETLEAIAKAHNIPSEIRNTAEEIDEQIQAQQEAEMQAQLQQQMIQQGIHEQGIDETDADAMLERGAEQRGFFEE